MEVLLGNEKYFELAIGRRKTKSELQLLPGGDIPIISARLDVPFGYIQSNSFICHKKKLVLWNIDSSRWDTRVLDKNTKFVPTDHCGYIKILCKDIVPEYLAYKLYEAGLAIGFKHEYRASLKNICDISICIPQTKNGNFDVKKQKAIASKYFQYLDIKKQLQNLISELSNNRINISSTAVFSSICINDIMTFKKGKAKYSERYCNNHEGQFPVYSAGTKSQNIIGKISSYDYFTECLKITTNGHYAGTVEYVPKSKFSINGDAGILYFKDKTSKRKFDYRYLEYALQKAREQYGFNWNNKPYENDILAIEIQVPIKNGSWDIIEQKRIAKQYILYKKYISELNSCVDDLKKCFIKVD